MKPDKLQKIALVGMCTLILVSFAVANIQSFVWVNSKWLVSTILPAVVVTETNDARAHEELQPLTRSAVLDAAAQMKADDMAKNGYFAHNSPAGITPWHWFKEAGYHYAYAGENLAVHFTDSTAVVDAWLKSPTHRANVLNGKYTEIGIGTAKGRYEGFDTVFVVQLFGTPAESLAVVTPTQEVATSFVATKPTPEAPHTQKSVTDTKTIARATATPSSSPITASMTDAGTVVYESGIATETPGAVLAATAVGQEQTPVSLWERFLTSPTLLLQSIYGIIGLIVMSLLFYTLIFEWKHHHPIQTAYSVGLLVMMIGLFFLHIFITGGIIT